MMPGKHWGNKPDNNADEVMQPIRDCKQGWLEGPGKGRDFVWFVKGKVYFIEIKNPMVRWSYTPSEILMKAMCEANGVEYVTLKTKEESEEFVGNVLR